MALTLEPLFRATNNFASRLIVNVVTLVYYIFGYNAWFTKLVQTIMGNEYLLIGFILLVCGSVLGILKRMIQL